jgi:N-acetylglucosaminyldiphosphoundecaprenol N-acetyl-beta-D-mannosaminyltransferase
MPLVWVGRWRGHALKHRVYGPDVLVNFCRETHARGYRHFFYGGAPGVPEALAAKLLEQFPMLQIAGTYSPPFRALTPEEDAGVVDMINRASADVLWVGLGCPKQEIWMHEHREGFVSRCSWALGRHLIFTQVVCVRRLAGCVSTAWNGCSA